MPKEKGRCCDAEEQNLEVTEESDCGCNCDCDCDCDCDEGCECCR